MVRAGAAQERTLRRRSGGGDDDRALVGGDLDRREPDPAGGSVDQHGLTRRQPPERAERIEGRHEGHRRRGRSGEIEPGRDRHDGTGQRRHPRRQRRRGEPDDPVADREPLDPRPHGADDPGAFEAEGRAGKAVDQRLLGQETHTPHHVAEIERRRRDIDRNLARAGGRRGGRRPGERVEPARLGAGEAERVVGCRPTRRQAAAQAQDMAARRGPHDLAVRAAHGELGGEPLGAFARRRRIGRQAGRADGGRGRASR